jgi:putative flavoprotein involved in K+ transport
MDSEQHVETLVVGAGQAGLATARRLTAEGRECLVLEARDRVGDGWRARWDSLRLFTTARYDGLPDLPFPGSPWHYPTRDEVADYLEDYADHFALPVRTGAPVLRLAREGDRFVAETPDGPITADAVVVATGMYRTPRIPDLATALDRGIVQLHSSAYRNPEGLPPGEVLVVGAGNSGSEIALEVARTRTTRLAGRSVGEEPTRSGTLPDRLFMPFMWFAASRVLSVDNPLGRRVREHFLHPPRGVPLGRARARDLAAAGVERVPRVGGVSDGFPQLEDGRTVGAATVIWCTGFDIDLSWVDLPLTVRDGYPEHDRGAVCGVPGLYLMGLPFLRTLSSGLLGGVARDSAMVTAQVVAHLDGSHAARSAAGLRSRQP